MRAIVVTTAAGRTTLGRVLLRINNRAGYPRDGVRYGGGVHATDAQGRTVGFVWRAHPTRTNERALVFNRPALRVLWQWIKDRIAERVAAGTADADDLAINALVETDLPADWQPTDTIAR